jgi:hypothetical protein
VVLVIAEPRLSSGKRGGWITHGSVSMTYYAVFASAQKFRITCVRSLYSPGSRSGYSGGEQSRVRPWLLVVMLLRCNLTARVCGDAVA